MYVHCTLYTPVVKFLNNKSIAKLLYMYIVHRTNPLHLPQCSVLLPPVGVLDQAGYAAPDGVLEAHGPLHHRGMHTDVVEEGEQHRLILARHLLSFSLYTGAIEPPRKFLATVRKGE